LLFWVSIDNVELSENTFLRRDHLIMLSSQYGNIISAISYVPALQTISKKEKEISIHCNFVNLVLIMKNSINERTPESSYI
jgi:hypothetical protein